MSEPTPEKTEAAPPALGELFELSLTALLNAPGVFLKLAARPAPMPSASFLLALAWGGAFFALNLIHIAIANPAMIQESPAWKIGAVAFCAFGAWTALYLLGSSLLYGLGRTLGSAGDFDRALLIMALALIAAPAWSLCSWLPAAWFVPALLSAWIAACGLHALFKANAWAARGVCAVLAAGVLAIQYGVAQVVVKYAAAAQLAAVAARSAPSAGQLAELQQQMQQIQALGAAAGKIAPNAPSRQSGLDLLRGPAAEEGAPAGPTQAQQLAAMSAQGDAMNKSMIGMLDSIAPMLNNPTITQNMTLQQKSDFAELKSMMLELKAGMAANKITSPQEQQVKMTKIQQLVMRMMSAAMTMPKPQAAPAPDAKR